MLLRDLALEDGPDCLFGEQLQVVFEEGSNSFSGLNNFNPDIGDFGGVDLKDDSIPFRSPSVKLLSPIAVGVGEVQPVEGDLHTGSAN